MLQSVNRRLLPGPIAAEVDRRSFIACWDGFCESRSTQVNGWRLKAVGDRIVWFTILLRVAGGIWVGGEAKLMVDRLVSRGESEDRSILFVEG